MLRVIFNFSLILLITFGMSSSISAQQEKEHFTYLGDKKFKKPNDLRGFEFVPSIMEIPGKDKKKLQAGDFKFGVAGENLIVTGGDIKGIYNINNINTTDYGFKMALMNARDPGMQGHLKVILLNKKFVDALVFKKSNHAPEIIFFLAEIKEELRLKEKEYFTDRSELVLEFADDVWGTELMPFYRVVNPRKKFQRIQMTDGVKIEFIETENVIEKTKKAPKKKKEPKVKDEEPVFADAEETQVEQEVIAESEEEEADEEDEEQSVFDSFFGEETTDEEEEEEEIVEEEVPESTEEDKLDTYFGADQNADAAAKEEDRIVKKVKYQYEYLIKLTDQRIGDSGFAEPITEEFKVKNIKMREDPTAVDPQYVYQIEFETNKGMVYMYLNNASKISSMDFGPVSYLMRGH